MIQHFEAILAQLLQVDRKEKAPILFHPAHHFHDSVDDPEGIPQAVNAAFLIALAGDRHPAYERAKAFLTQAQGVLQWEGVAAFYQDGIELIHQELEALSRRDPDFAAQMEEVSAWVSHPENLGDGAEVAEKLWSIFFPEAVGLRKGKEEAVESLRKRRTVTITETNPAPIQEVDRQVLFTSNVLLTLPPASKSLEGLPLSDGLKASISETLREPQVYWYDHPVQVGVAPENNEILYGLRGLRETLTFERERGSVPEGARLTCVLSVSVTHPGLHEVAKSYVEEEFARYGGLEGLDVYIFTETETRRIIDDVLAPAAERFLNAGDARKLLGVLGVDGEYGRHYSFLKAIAAFWNVLVNPDIRATFKIDLDQVFPQQELVEETGRSALENFTTPLWGARAIDSSGKPVELGMIAGALVNENDIGQSVFTPDVRFPDRTLFPDEYVFFSMLPQALSTEAEMMTRYTPGEIDGQKKCIERIHVTGGTNGILVDSLRRHRPFTPSFIGRAEDQAYILSVFSNPDGRLAYLHQDGLIMRHDKSSFAQEAIEAASLGKSIGDYVRILYFSRYAGALPGNENLLKQTADPFTGCFISRIPITIVFLRMAVRASAMFSAGETERGREFIIMSARRLKEALEFVGGRDGSLKRQFERERSGWDLYYDVLSALERALLEEDEFAAELRDRATKIVAGCSVRTDS